MDTSKEFILMCEKAKEIQKNKDILEQNTYLIPAMILGKMEIANCFQFISYGKDMKKGWIYFFLGTKPPLKVMLQEYWDKIIWLPRQDDLQKMYLDNRKYKINCNQMSMFFEDWRCDELMRYGKDLIAWSMEQLWLAFVMSQKWGKVWDGKGWVKEV